MGTTALAIVVFYLVLVVIGVTIALAIWRSTRRQKPVDPEVLERRERVWMVVVVVLLVALLVPSLFFIPFNDTAGANGQTVNVIGKQFAWEIEAPPIQAGVPVQFLATSPDVNHGFGVYNEDNVLLFQAQVIPGKVQKVVYTFQEPGTYEVLCMEFCGLGHHLMITTFDVVP